MRKKNTEGVVKQMDYLVAYENNTNWLKNNASLETTGVPEESVKAYTDVYASREVMRVSLCEMLGSTLVALGGVNRLNAMLNAREFRVIPLERGGLAFKFSGNPDVNYLEIIVAFNDTYTIRSHYLRAGKLSRTKEEKDIYVDELKHRVEQHIQLYLSL